MTTPTTEHPARQAAAAGHALLDVAGFHQRAASTLDYLASALRAGNAKQDQYDAALAEYRRSLKLVGAALTRCNDADLNLFTGHVAEEN
jgi:hypothetical protein